MIICLNSEQLYITVGPDRNYCAVSYPSLQLYKNTMANIITLDQKKKPLGKKTTSTTLTFNPPQKQHNISVKGYTFG